EAGDVWEAVSLFTSDFFFEKLVDLDSTNQAIFQPPDARWEPGEGALLGVRALLDDGAWRYALLDDLAAFRGDGERPLGGMAPAGGEFTVRVTGLVGRRRPVKVEDRFLELDPADRAAEASAWDQDAPLPPVSFRVPLLDLIFRNTTFAVDEGFWHR